MTTTQNQPEIVNFGAGPAKLPPEVLERAQKELLQYPGAGISVLEMSHRGSEFVKIIDSTETTLRQLLNIPSNYKVLFLQGGGNGQFAAIPLNLIGRRSSHAADYIITGSWSASAAKEAEKYATVNRILPPSGKYGSIPEQSTWKLNPDASYVYYCDNETIDGVEFPFIPETNGVPIVCDMSSNFLSRPFDINKFGMVFAGAQKNIGCAGVAVVIVRSDLLDFASPQTPLIFDYKKQAAQKSSINTPPTFSIYIVGLVLDWMKERGGVDYIHSQNVAKATAVYNLIDNSDGFYCCTVERSCRSNMNIPIRIGGQEGNEAVEKKFVQEATRCGMIQLNGHRSVGGLRVSLYNAITTDDVRKLVAFMLDFQIHNSN
jgi:phosphoserine aminotransferase